MDPATLEARPGVFGAGDVTGLGGFTHLAYYHGQVVARRLRGMDARADHTAVPRVTFTDPEIASVGLSEAAARAKGIDVVVASADPAETARGYIHDFHGGALKLVGDRERGVLIGATLVTPRAGEIVGELVLAIKLGTPLKTLADVIHPFPAFNRVLGESLDELAAKVALQSARDLTHSHHAEVMMSTQTSNEHATRIPTPATVDLKLEVVVIPVSDVDRAKRFYESLGWRLDADFANGDGLAGGADDTSRLAVLHPLRQGNHDGSAGLSARICISWSSDIEAARTELIGRGADVSEVFHFDRVRGTTPCRAATRNGRSYGTYASFSDPDGNSWLLQEIKTRLPGRGLSNLDVATLTELLREAEEHHGEYEPTAPKHHWSDWYAAYIVAREQGKTPEEAAKDGALHMESLRR